MATDTPLDQLKADVREQTGYTDTAILSADALDTACRNAKRHIRVEESLPQESQFDWFDPNAPEREEALYWWTCLFAKMATGELDAQTVQVGAVDSETLLAKADDEVTMWYRNAASAKRSLNASSIFQSATVVREGRTYGSGSSSSGGSSGLSTDNV